MVERRPHRVSFETWIDRQVREAMERGEFDNLPGAGQPLRGIDDPYDEMWWVKQKLKRENVSILPGTLALRKEAEDALSAAKAAKTEPLARLILTDINGKIRDALLRPLTGPPLSLMPFDVEGVIEQWRCSHPEPPPSLDAEPAPSKPGSSTSAPWWRRVVRGRRSRPPR
jgi:hypothetical protein